MELLLLGCLFACLFVLLAESTATSSGTGRVKGFVYDNAIQSPVYTCQQFSTERRGAEIRANGRLIHLQKVYIQVFQVQAQKYLPHQMYIIMPGEADRTVLWWEKSNSGGEGGRFWSSGETPFGRFRRRM